MRYLTKLMLLTVYLAASPRVEANNWNVVGAGCLPIDPDIQNNNYIITAGTVKANLVTDPLTLYCPVPATISSPTQLILSFADGRDSSTNFVSAQYFKMSITSGMYGYLTLIATASSENISCNMSPCENGMMRYATTTIVDAYDPQHYVYFVKVTIDRDASTDVATFYGATLN